MEFYKQHLQFIFGFIRLVQKNVKGDSRLMFFLTHVSLYIDLFLREKKKKTNSLTSRKVAVGQGHALATNISFSLKLFYLYIASLLSSFFIQYPIDRPRGFKVITTKVAAIVTENSKLPYFYLILRQTYIIHIISIQIEYTLNATNLRLFNERIIRTDTLIELKKETTNERIFVLLRIALSPFFFFLKRSMYSIPVESSSGR